MNFHEAKYLIVDHFDEKINRIDIQIETLLSNDRLTKREINDLNDVREKQIEKINEFKRESLSRLKQKNESEINAKFDSFIKKNNQTIDFIITSEFILNDLILIDDSHSISKQILCILPECSKLFDKNNIM